MATETNGHACKNCGALCVDEDAIRQVEALARENTGLRDGLTIHKRLVEQHQVHETEEEIRRLALAATAGVVEGDSRRGALAQRPLSGQAGRPVIEAMELAARALTMARTWILDHGDLPNGPLHADVAREALAALAAVGVKP